MFTFLQLHAYFLHFSYILSTALPHPFRTDLVPPRGRMGVQQTLDKLPTPPPTYPPNPTCSPMENDPAPCLMSPCLRWSIWSLAFFNAVSRDCANLRSGFGSMYLNCWLDVDPPSVDHRNKGKTLVFFATRNLTPTFIPFGSTKQQFSQKNQLEPGSCPPYFLCGNGQRQGGGRETGSALSARSGVQHGAVDFEISCERSAFFHATYEVPLGCPKAGVATACGAHTRKVCYVCGNLPAAASSTRTLLE